MICPLVSKCNVILIKYCRRHLLIEHLFVPITLQFNRPNQCLTLINGNFTPTSDCTVKSGKPLIVATFQGHSIECHRNFTHARPLFISSSNHEVLIRRKKWICRPRSTRMFVLMTKPPLRWLLGSSGFSAPVYCLTFIVVFCHQHWIRAEDDSTVTTLL